CLGDLQRRDPIGVPSVRVRARSHFSERRLILARLSSTPQRRTMKTIQDALPLSGHPFTRRHIGPGPEEAQAMLDALGYTSLDAVIEDAIPASVRFRGSLSIGYGASELEVLTELRAHGDGIRVLGSYVGLACNDTFTRPVILRSVLKNSN